MGVRGPGRGVVRPVSVRGGIVFQGEWLDASGRRRRKYLAKTKQDAERILSKIIRDRDLELAGMASESGQSMAYSALVEQYLADLAARSKPSYVKRTRALLDRVQGELGARTVKDLTRVALTRWRLTRLSEGAANQTCNNSIAMLSAALELAVRLGQIHANPIAGLRRLPISAQYQVRKPRAFTEDEIARLLAAAARADQVKIRGTSTQRGKRLPFPREPLVRALLATGARWGELVATRWMDLDEARALLTLRAETTKTSVARVIPLDRDTLASMVRLRDEAKRITGKAPAPSSRIFLSSEGCAWGRTSNFGKHFQRLLAAAKIPRRDEDGRVACIHSCRHSAATRLARAGVPVQIAQLITGHRSASILMSVYTHLRVEDARAAVEGLPKLPKTTTEERPAPGKIAEPGAR